MRDHFFPSLLLGAVLIGALATAGLAVYYVRNVKKLQRLQIQAAVINQNRAIMRDLTTEAMEYSKRNPAMERVLDSVGIRQKAAEGQSNAPFAPPQN